mgnify:CR=1 FL=1
MISSSISLLMMSKGCFDVLHFHVGLEITHQRGHKRGRPFHVTRAEAVARFSDRRFRQAVPRNAGQDVAGVADNGVAAHSRAPLR